MRALAVLMTLVGFMLPAYGAKRVTVANLEQMLAAARNLPDGDLAKQLSDLELTERLNTVTFDRMESALAGEQSRQALMILADESAFLDPPLAEVPAQPAPDPATQRKILALTVNYATQSLHELPNFFGTRVTTNFEDSPALTRPGAITTPYQPIHLVGDSNVTVTFREGREVVEKSSFDPRIRSLMTSGVFGPILGTVLIDAARSKLAWSHWEKGPTGLRAVFSYEVPKGNSHYTITHDSVPENCSTVPQTSSQVIAYHGEMAIDPASGTILRLILLADMKPDEFTVKSGIEVEYGQVSIGGKDYFLPIRSVTFSVAHSLQVHGGWGHGQGCLTLVVTPSLQNSLNDVAFKNYHVFRSDATVLTYSEAANLDRQNSRAPTENSSQQTEEPTAPPLGATRSATPLPQSGPQSAPSASTAANSASPSAPDSQPTSQALSNTAASAPLPAPVAMPPASASPSTTPENAASTANSADIPVFRTTTREVLVDVIVNKGNGDPVPGLPQSDFSIAEDGRPRTIDFFEEHSASASAPIAQPSMPPLPPGAVTNVPTAPPSAALYILLLDSLNTESQDQANVRDQVLSYLHKMDPGTQVAVFALGSSLRLLQAFTSDPAALLAAVSGKVAKRDAMAQNRSDNADDSAHIANLQSMRASPAAIEARQAADLAAHAYNFGARASMTYEALNAVARYLEGIPGRKNLVWFASSFPVVFFPTPTQLDHLKNNPNLLGYINEVKQTANLFILSKIAVYPVSGAGVMNSNIGMADSPDADSAGGTGHFGTAENPTASLTGEALNFASATAGMEQLASSTGGRAFTTNDIDNALRKIVHDSDVYYTVGYAPTDSATDGSFHRIDVKVAGGKYKLAYRQGYNASESGAAPADDPIVPLLQLGMPSATGIFYGARVEGKSGNEPPTSDTGPAGQNPQLKGPLTRYTVSLTIRAQDVSFGQAPNGERIAKLLIGIKAYGKDGAALNWQASQEAAEISPTEYASFLKTGVPVSIDLDLPANTPAKLVTAVYDWNTNRSGTLEIPLHP
jgi:VWFA-related protein